MAQYHIGSSGRPAICRATVSACPLGGQHFGSRQDAQDFVDSSAASESARVARLEQVKKVSSRLTRDFWDEMKTRSGDRAWNPKVNVFWAGHSSQIPEQYRVASSVKALDEFLVMGMGDDGSRAAFKVDDYLVKQHPAVFSGVGFEWSIFDISDPDSEIEYVSLFEDDQCL